MELNGGLPTMPIGFAGSHSKAQFQPPCQRFYRTDRAANLDARTPAPGIPDLAIFENPALGSVAALPGTYLRISAVAPAVSFR
jgi:hypothetical protein